MGRMGFISDSNFRDRVLLFAVTLSMLTALAISAPLPAFPGTASSSPYPGSQDKPIRTAEILVFDTPTPAKTEVGVHIVLEPGWYIYWTNPGDAGLPPALRWQLPEGFRAGPPRYPVPEKIRYGDLVVYGFHDEVLILAEISAERTPAAGEKATFTAVLDWMACRESCLVGRESPTVSPAGLTPAEIRRARDIRSRFSKRFPKPTDGSFAVDAAAVARSPRGWTVEVALSGVRASRVRDFYPHPVEGFVIDHSRIGVSAGKVLIPLTPSTASAGLAVVSGILIVDSTGYEVDIPVK